eukprot:GFYU01000614.1.p1 GENE.GFYU01000614.1~~GFYU01000614.1.p1  ORF type:complete len:163 (+),score=23.89 GFYU01000614.1:89-577(+)
MWTQKKIIGSVQVFQIVLGVLLCIIPGGSTWEGILLILFASAGVVGFWFEVTKATQIYALVSWVCVIYAIVKLANMVEGASLNFFDWLVYICMGLSVLVSAAMCSWISYNEYTSRPALGNLGTPTGTSPHSTSSTPYAAYNDSSANKKAPLLGSNLGAASSV